MSAVIRSRLPWALLAVLVLAQICYPLTGGATRAGLTVATVVLGWLLSVGHALLTRGVRTAVALIAVVTGGGFAVEAVGVATGFPFGSYDYSGELGPKLAGVPLIIPLAWTWMAWPAWLTAVRLVRSRLARIALSAVGLAAWDLFLDPQMVAEGYWTWLDATPALPGLPGIPVSNYLGWLGFAVLLAVALRPLAGPSVDRVDGRDAPMFALYLWTYASSVLAHAVFLRLPASALWGAAGMAVAAVPLAVTLWRARRRDRTGTPEPAPRVDAPA
ncbi:carotenoid biosynthesis protein [Micromonospora aurantiaca (nom. illeg.)]|uniref:carotenoid biosynthesis protein n=1 Tax=Micromonospora aurantiaca (nom. illeg.) TaxID=47850 RepID=UPI003F4A8458